MDPTFIVMVSFVLFMGVAYRLGYHRSMSALDRQISNIRQALNEAAQAKEAALQALAEERRRYGEILEEIELISKRTEEQALTLRQQTLQDIDKIIHNRQQEAENMVERLHHEAVQTIQEEATAKTLETFKALVTAKFSPAQQEAINEGAIAQITAQLTENQAALAHKPKRQKSKRSASK
jgi:F0F1-type ATP synthase membrane subunit b/b'